jgi:uncharacterized protein (DUF2132 family)
LKRSLLQTVQGEKRITKIKIARVACIADESDELSLYRCNFFDMVDVRVWRWDQLHRWKVVVVRCNQSRSTLKILTRCVWERMRVLEAYMPLYMRAMSSQEVCYAQETMTFCARDHLYLLCIVCLKFGERISPSSCLRTQSLGNLEIRGHISGRIYPR